MKNNWSLSDLKSLYFLGYMYNICSLSDLKKIWSLSDLKSLDFLKYMYNFGSLSDLKKDFGSLSDLKKNIWSLSDLKSLYFLGYMQVVFFKDDKNRLWIEYFYSL